MKTSHGCGNGGIKQEQDLGTCHFANWKKTSWVQMGIHHKVSS